MLLVHRRKKKAPEIQKLQKITDEIMFLSAPGPAHLRAGTPLSMNLTRALLSFRVFSFFGFVHVF